jgi:murein DD-endopeptidase MepM/ murein hydrolase activator NlpD
VAVGSPTDALIVKLSTGHGIPTGRATADDHPGSMTDLGSRLRPFTRLLILVLASVLITASAVAPSTRALAASSWVWPLDPEPEVVAGFDPPDERWNAGHRGVDLAGWAGEPVLSAGDGVVTFAGMLGGRGVVVVSHGLLRTTYLPVDSIVSVGQRVEAGEVIGTLAVIGGHCLPRVCLHWGLLRGSTYLNPLTLVGAGPIRLLPDPGSSTLRGLFMPTSVSAVPAFVLPVAATALPDQARGWARP